MVMILQPQSLNKVTHPVFCPSSDNNKFLEIQNLLHSHMAYTVIFGGGLA